MKLGQFSKTEVDKLDIDKLVPVPVDLGKLSDVMKSDVKKTVYDKLVAKVNNVDTNGSVLKTNMAQKKSQKIKLLLHKLNAKTTEIEGKIASVSGLATNAALTEVENKLPNVSNLVKKRIMIQKLMKLKRNLLIMIMINILLLLSLISFQLKFLMQD